MVDDNKIYWKILHKIDHLDTSLNNSSDKQLPNNMKSLRFDFVSSSQIIDAVISNNLKICENHHPTSLSLTT